MWGAAQRLRSVTVSKLVLSVQNPTLQGAVCFVAGSLAHVDTENLITFRDVLFFLKQSVTHTLSHSNNFSSSAKPIIGSHMFPWLNIEPILTSS